MLHLKAVMPKEVFIAILSSVLLAAFACAGYWFGTQQVSTLSPTADWHTYQKENIPFTFKYPKDATLWGREEGVIQISLWGPTQKSGAELHDGLSLRFHFRSIPPTSVGGEERKEDSKGGYSFGRSDGHRSETPFYLPKTFDNKSLRDYVGAVRGEYATGESIVEISEVEEITLNGLVGYTFSTKYLEHQGARHIYLQSPHQPNAFVEIVDATLDPTNQGFEGIADQILSTFKFLD